MWWRRHRTRRSKRGGCGESATRRRRRPFGARTRSSRSIATMWRGCGRSHGTVRGSSCSPPSSVPGEAFRAKVHSIGVRCGRRERDPRVSYRRFPPPAAAGAQAASDGSGAQAASDGSGAQAASDGSGARAAISRRFGVPDGEPWLLCVAMMRSGRKLASFEVLADALARPVSPPRVGILWWPARDRRGARWSRPSRAGCQPGGSPSPAGSKARCSPPCMPVRSFSSGRRSASRWGWRCLRPRGTACRRCRRVPAAWPDIVRHAQTGLLVPEGNAAAFADALEALLRAPERRRRMGRAARARVAREHGFEAASERIGNLIESLIRRPPGSAGLQSAEN